MKTKKIFLAIILIIAFTIIYLDVENNYKKGFLVEENGSITVYFCPQDNCSDSLIKILNDSEKAKCAFFDLNDRKITSLAKQRNFEFLIDEDNYENYGKKIESEGLMHNKFCILDDKNILTGSFNPTSENTNHNNIIMINSKILAKNYENEFEAIKSGKKKTKTENTKIIFNGYILENYFCPQDNCKNEILDEINSATHSVYFLTFTFTDREIAQVLIDKHKEGLEIKGVIESFQNKKYWVADELIKNGINVTIHGSDHFQHNKIFIIDNTTLITGSFNPTRAANEINDENILIIREREIVNSYLKLLLTLTDQNDGKSLSMNPTKESE